MLTMHNTAASSHADPSPSAPSHIACLGGGHGLYQTLLAARESRAEMISAIVTVADDGGSSGRLRRELEIIPPGDLRMALAALANGEDGDLWVRTLQHRFGGHGALAGHAVGNLLIAGLTEVLGDYQAALDRVAELTNSRGRVLPAVNQALEIEAEVAQLDDDPRVLRAVRGQVAVASTPGQVRRVRTIPESPAANPLAVDALRSADLITLGPGSWFSSVLPHVLVPQIVEAINDSDALRVVILNLAAEPGETRGFSVERHLHVLAQHASNLRVDRIVVDEAGIPNAGEREYVQRAAQNLGASAVFADVRVVGSDGSAKNIHDPAKLAQALVSLYGQHLKH